LLARDGAFQPDALEALQKPPGVQADRAVPSTRSATSCLRKPVVMRNNFSNFSQEIKKIIDTI
jgi:hypothetical protein